MKDPRNQNLTADDDGIDRLVGPYDGVFKSFHWLIVALVTVQFMIAWTMPDLPRGTPPSGLVSAHLTVGLTILTLMLLRLLWRLTHAVPAPPQDIARWEQVAARLTHFAFYVLLIAMPLARAAWASAKGWDVSLLGVKLPALLTTGSPYRSVAAQAHETLGTVILGLVALHAGAALRHRFWLKDDIMQRMLPGHDAAALTQRRLGKQNVARRNSA